MNKVIEISIIENIGKKKKSRDKEMTIMDYKAKILNDLEEVISLNYFKIKKTDDIKLTDDIKKYNKFVEIRNKFVIFYNAYIELNKCFMTKHSNDTIIKDIIDELVTNVIYRAENIEVDENIKEVKLLRELIEKNNGERIKVEMG
jgi:hypothetical protein